VLTTANQAGGAHLDPKLDPAYEALARKNTLGWEFATDDEEGQPFKGDAALASVREVADELDRTIREELPHLLDPSVLGENAPLPRLLRADVGRNDPCPCGSGKKFKRCHGR
jgi:hypothetical protein